MKTNPSIIASFDPPLPSLSLRPRLQSASLGRSQIFSPPRAEVESAARLSTRRRGVQNREERIDKHIRREELKTKDNEAAARRLRSPSNRSGVRKSL